MFVKENYAKDLSKSYEILLKQLQTLIENECDAVANFANAAALLNQFLADINWVGFYLNKNQELVLGPFQGLPACIRIPFGKGVCGTAAKMKETVIVRDVHQFSGHIACDSASNSEIVIPIIDKNRNVLGVLDIDSPLFDRFGETDKKYLEQFVEILVKQLNNC